MAASVLPRVREAVERLPAISSARDRLLVTLKGDRAIDDALPVLESDPALALRALRAANAGKARGTVASVASAAVSLGPAGLAALADSIEVADPLLALPAALPWELFRRHALATRVAMERLLEHSDYGEDEELLTAALLHDVGKLVLFELEPGYLARDRELEARRESDLVRERREVAIDHAAAGGELARHWGFPERLCQAIEGHHRHGPAEPGGLVRLADMLAYYGQGDRVELEEVVELSDQLTVDRAVLRDLLYELPQVPATSRPIQDCPLSPRELEVLKLLAQGQVYKQIAAELDLAPSTVRVHLHRIYTRLGVADRTQAVLEATHCGWI